MLSAQEKQEIELFLRLLFPWEDDEKDLWKSVTWSFQPKEGEAGMANFAAQSFDDLIKLISTRRGRAGANVYVALGTQRVTSADQKTSTDGFYKAARQIKNIVSFNSIFLDIDVKPKAYATTQDAFAALDDFIAKQGLPPPTMEIYSGSGGLHIYWCTKNSMPLPDWLVLAKALRDAAMAYGLKFDQAVTVNPVGILRVPNTFNHKLSPPAKVRLYREAHHTFPRYDYQELVGALTQFVGSVGVSQGASTNTHNKNFIDNVSDSSAPPVTIEEVAENCPVIDDILDRGGDGDAEPLWNLALLAASFTSDPYAAAHALSEGDPRYTKAGTEKKLLEKINARAANPNLGWPKCDAFSREHPRCATCPLFARGKSPFNFVVRATTAAQQNFNPAGTDPLMPIGYWRNKNNHVMTMLHNKKGEPYAADIINYPILDGSIDPPNGVLLYGATIGGIDKLRQINVSSNMQPAAMAGALSKDNGLFIDTKHHTAARDFLVSWVQHLQTINRVSSQSSYGWSRDHLAFAFDDKIYRANTVETVHKGKHHDASFAVTGKLKPWQDAMHLVYGNMPLETVVASAFAAPLVEMVGSASLVMSIYSPGSGIGKSTAMSLAQAVWGNPRSGMSTLADTTNSMMKKIGDLKSLPVYWDELRTKDQLEKVIDIVFQVTQGKTKARLTREIEQADTTTFTTMFVVASNHGIVDTVYSQTESTEAGGLRVFEIDAYPLKPTMTSYQAGQLQIPLEDNYGVAGAFYAKYLAGNRPQIEKIIEQVSESFAQHYKLEAKERFWGMTMTALMVGAMCANHSGLTKFDLVKLRAYLVDMLTAQRSEMKSQEYSTLAATADVEGLLQEMISEMRGKSLIVTEFIPYVQAGRPVKNEIIDPEPQNVARLGDIWIHVGDKDQRIRMRIKPLNRWLRERRLNPRTILRALEGKYMVTMSRQKLGAGVKEIDATVVARSACVDLTPRVTSSVSPSPD